MSNTEAEIEPKIRRIIAILESMELNKLIKYYQYLGQMTVKESFERGLILHYSVCSDIIRLKTDIDLEHLRMRSVGG